MPTEWLNDYKGRGNILEVRISWSLCLIEHHTMRMYGGMQVQLHRFLASSLASCLDCFVFRDMAEWVPKQKAESPYLC
jgi:hypothetical protein